MNVWNHARVSAKNASSQPPAATALRGRLRWYPWGGFDGLVGIPRASSMEGQITYVLKLVEPNPSSDASWWAMAKEQAKMLVGTGFLPNSIKTPEQCVAIMMKARELGLPSMYGLSNIVIIQGKPTCSAELMLALIYRDHGDNAMQFVSASNEECTVAYRRRNWEASQRYSFTLADAQRANLTSPTWKQYPAAMLRARCISAVARMAFPDSIAGFYTPEELGAPVAIDEEATGNFQVVDTNTGEIIEQSPATPQPLQDERVGDYRDKGGCWQSQLSQINILARQKGVTPEGIRAGAQGFGHGWEDGERAGSMMLTFPDAEES
jgi:hypothetical protein